MAKKDWEKLALDNESNESSDLAAMGVSRHPGRGFKILSVVLAIAAGAFIAGYYVPLYRAHSKLRDEYQTASKEASTFRKQLVDTVDTLNRTNEECGHLRNEVSKQKKEGDAAATRLERLEKSLQGPLKPYQGKGRLSIERQRDKVLITLAAPALVAATGGALTEPGKKALCALGSSLKDGSVQVVIRGLGVDPADKSGAAWLPASARAGNAAQQLVKGCGVDPSRLEVSIATSTTAAPAGAALALEVSPKG